MSNKILQDQKGNLSSKRLLGAILIGSGVLFSIALFVFSLFWGAKDSRTALDIIQLFLVVGGGLVGIGVFENGFININKK